MAPTMAKKTNPSRAPTRGIQLMCVCSGESTDCAIPMASPAATVHPNDMKRPMSAAPSAGMSNCVNSSGVSSNSGAATMPTTPAMSADTTHVIMPSRSGANPSSNAPFSDSDAARMARPVRV